MLKNAVLIAVFTLAAPQLAAAYDIDKVDGHSRIDRSDINAHEFSIREVNGQSHLRLSGVAGTLRIGKIDGQSTIDAHCLATDEVIIDELNGQSDLLIQTKQFTFRLIDGQSVVVLRHSGPGRIIGTNKIDGQSRILWSGSEAPLVSIRETNGSSRVSHVCF
jgi:hypothetical protein